MNSTQFTDQEHDHAAHDPPPPPSQAPSPLLPFPLQLSGLTGDGWICSTTRRQTRLAIPRATRCTAIRIPRCKLPGKPQHGKPWRVARNLPAHASAAAPGGVSASTAAAPAAQKTATKKRHLRRVAAKEPEEDEVLAVPAKAEHHNARRRGALDTGFAAGLVRPSRRLQARIHHLRGLYIYIYKYTKQTYETEKRKEEGAPYLAWRSWLPQLHPIIQLIPRLPLLESPRLSFSRRLIYKYIYILRRKGDFSME